MSKVFDILQKKGPYFNIVSPDTKVIDALALMKSENLGYVIIKEDDEYLGIMSERDYTLKIKLNGRASDSTTVRDIMSRDLPIISYQEPDLKRCMVLMNVYKTRYLPVFDEIEFKGVLTMNDIMQEVIEDDSIQF